MTLKIILGLYRPDSGKVFVNGEDITTMSEEGLYRVRQKMGMVFQSNALFDSLTVGENVSFRLRELALAEDVIEEKVIESLSFVGLEHAIDMMPSELSGGMKKRVAIARAIASSPEILLYDEPTTGLDPTNALNVCRLIRDLRDKKGVSSIVVTHELQYAFMVADDLSVIHEGELIFKGTPAELNMSEDERVGNFLGSQLKIT
jgi:phospholipid/cholesterol/gamma-HCH transport system ATP-binding protein